MFDKRKFGHPRTEAERRARHKRIYGKGKPLPKRGTGVGNVAKAIRDKIK